MPTIRVEGFDGEIPRRASTMLEVNQATIARNVKLYSRELRNWRGPLLTIDPGRTGARSFYKLDNGTNEVWLTWEAYEVDVAPGPVADLAEARIYFTGDGNPKKTNYALASSGAGPYPTTAYDIGVPAPSTAPGVSAPAIVTATHYLTINEYVAVGDSGALTGDLVVTTARKTGNYDNLVSRNGGNPWQLNPRDRGPDLVPVDGDYNYGAFLSEQVSFTQTPNAIALRTFPTLAPVAQNTTISTAAPDTETRAYLYTFVATFGTVKEESAPSPASNLVTGEVGAAFTVSALEAAPPGNYNITHLRIYRSVTGATTDSYQFVAEQPIGTTSYADSLLVTHLGEVLPSQGWTMPPNDLAGLVALPYGSLAGFSGNTVYWSEPFYPHAWPLDYAVSLPFKIVGLGVIGATLVVMTEAFPYMIYGSTPGALSVEQIPLQEPCVGRRSIVSDTDGVIYASPNGLVSLGPSSRGIMTAQLYKRDEWQALNPSSISAIVYDGKYIALFDDTTRPALIVNREGDPALSFLDVNAHAFWVEPTTANLYKIDADDERIYQVDADDATILEYTWHSKRFSLPKGMTFSAVQIDADFSQISGSRTLEFKFYGDGTLQTTLDVTARDPMRLPAFRSRDVEFELTGEIDVRSIVLATSVEELRG
jgi:hypothetical protein